MFKKQRHTAEEYIHGILNRDRILLSKAITLIESKLPSDDKIAEAVLEKILPFTGNSLRIGITGVPGAGKSTFIESFGKHLTSTGKKVAVLSIDPTSQRTHGSILGDKTRMEELANDPNAFIRPSASGNTLGGVHSKTRETMLLCEAAGFDVILIETVGVGQSETSVKSIVDFFLLLMLAGAGDELQGIKRGIMEMADAIIINKADGDNITKCEIARREYQNALHMFPPSNNGWYPKVLTSSALNKSGLNEIWEVISGFESQMKQSGHFFSNRQQQNLQWMHDVISYYLHHTFFNHKAVKEQINYVENQVEIGNISAIKAARGMIDLFV